MRVKLCDKYKEEREEICNRLLDILNLDDNKSFLLCDLDEDIERQTAILSMKEEIKKCFAVSSLATFKNDRECKRPYLNIVRGILRKQGYTFEGKDNKILKSHNLLSTTKYFVFRLNSDN
jgi:hypothetical protein